MNLEGTVMNIASCSTLLSGSERRVEEKREETAIRTPPPRFVDSGEV